MHLFTHCNGSLSNAESVFKYRVVGSNRRMHHSSRINKLLFCWMIEIWPTFSCGAIEQRWQWSIVGMLIHWTWYEASTQSVSCIELQSWTVWSLEPTTPLSCNRTSYPIWILVNFLICNYNCKYSSRFGYFTCRSNPFYFFHFEVVRFILSFQWSC